MKVWIYTFKWPSYLSAFLLGAVIVYVGYLYHEGLSIEYVSQPAISFSLIDKKVIIDPGHGGVDPGAEGPGGAMEKDITLAVSHRLNYFLQQGGADVMMIREDDRDWSTSPKGYSVKKREDLKHRVEMIEESSADILVSIHVNAFPSAKWSGSQTFYYSDSEDSKELAEIIQQALVDNMGNTTRKAKPIDSYLLRNTSPVGTIVEVGFISNPEEEELMTDPEYQEKLAWAIYKGIINYLNEQN